MKIVLKKLSELKFAPYNPRTIDPKEYEKLKRSIETFGYVDPLVWNKRTGHVVGGNQRLKVLQDLGFEEVEVVEIDVDLPTEKALNVALNRISGEWDYAKLAEVLESLPPVYQELTGFDEEEIDNLLKDFQFEELPDDFGKELSEEKDLITVKVKCPKERIDELELLLQEKGFEYEV